VWRRYWEACRQQFSCQPTAAEIIVPLVRVATFDDPSWFRPEADIFVQSAQPWDHMNPDIPKYPTYPPGMSYPAGAKK